MNLWHTRNQAIKSLGNELAPEAALLDRAFQLLQFATEKLYAVDPQTPFIRITAVIAVKARNLLHCSYSLTLDGHAQESGAIGRVLVEAVELLAYLHADPARVDQVIHGRLPPAGERARMVRGHLKSLRQHWNVHASHFNASYESLAHTINFAANRLVLRQPFKVAVLRKNLESVFVFALWACLETLRCLAKATSDPQERLARVLDELRRSGFQQFGVGAGSV